MSVVALFAAASWLIAGQETTSPAVDPAGQRSPGNPVVVDSTAKATPTLKPARTSWYPTQETRPLVEIPDRDAVGAKTANRKTGAGMLGARLRSDGILFQLGFRDLQTTTGQWTAGIGCTWKSSEDKQDSLESSRSSRGISGRLGREIWFQGPGTLSLVGSATAQIAGRSIDSTYNTIVQVENATWTNSSNRYRSARVPRSLTTGEVSFGLLFGAGLRIHSASGRTAFFAGVEAGPGWLSSEDEIRKISHSEATLMEPSWQIGLEWCF